MQIVRRHAKVFLSVRITQTPKNQILKKTAATFHGKFHMKKLAISRTGQFRFIGGSAAERLRKKWAKGVEARKNGTIKIEVFVPGLEVPQTVKIEVPKAKKAKVVPIAQKMVDAAPIPTPAPLPEKKPFVVKAAQIEAPTPAAPEPALKIEKAPKPAKAKPAAKQPETFDHLNPAQFSAMVENLQADILRLKTERTKIASDYDEKRDAARVEQINKRLKDLYFMRSKLAPVPPMPKLKKVILSGFKSGEFIGTDAQILNHLKNIRACQKQAEKEGLPCEGLRVQIVPA